MKNIIKLYQIIQIQYFLTIYFYCIKISKIKTKNLSILKTSSHQMLKYIIISEFKKTSYSYRIYYSYCSCKYFYKVINAIILVSHTCKDKHFVTQYEHYDIHGLICIFSKKVRSFEDYYLNLFFECQDVGINIFTSFSNFNSSSFKLKQSDNINFSIPFLLKILFNKQQILKK